MPSRIVSAFAPLGIPVSSKQTMVLLTHHRKQDIPTALGCVITHHTGIPKLATGQGIMERLHGTLKQKGGMCGETPQSRVAKAMYTLNHLRILEKSHYPVI